jgi:enhancing lycopene biosynthesis protein 2
MAKRVGVILSGCGRRDGSDVAEAVLALLVIERAGAVAVCAAPDAEQAAIADHLSGAVAGPPRQARVEAARIIGAPILPLTALDAAAIDALVIPGGEGAATLLSNYADKHELCQVDPEIARLLRALLAAHKPMGFLGLSALLAARVLGPVAGVRVTLGPRGTTPSKHAAIMGADVRPATADDVIADQKARVFTTPGFLVEGAGLAAVARSMDKLVRAVVGGARDRAPAAAAVLGAKTESPPPPAAAAGPSIGRPANLPSQASAVAPREISAIEPRRRPRHARRY